MKKEKNKIKNSIKLSILVFIASFVGIYTWMISLHVGVQVYQSKKLGSGDLGKIASDKLFSSNVPLIIASYVIMEILIMWIAILMVKKYNEGKFKLDYIGMKVDENSLKFVAYGFGIVAVMNVFMYFVMTALGVVNFKECRFDYTLLLIFITTAFPGFCEEIVFRGVIQKYLMEKVSTPLAVLISSLCFSVLHVGRYSDFMSLFCIVIIGIVFGYIFAKTKSLYLSIGIHFAWDFFASIIGVGKSMFNTEFLFSFQIKSNGELVGNIITVVMFLVLLGIVIIIYKNRENKLQA